MTRRSNRKNQIISKYEFSLISKPNDFEGFKDIFIRCLFHLSLLLLSLHFYEQKYYIIAFLFLVPHYMAWSFLGWSGIGHELFHKKVFTNKKFNTVLFRVFSVLCWSNYGYFETSHTIHHKNPLSGEDFEVSPQGRLVGWALIGSLTFDLGTALRRVIVLTKNAFGQGPTGAEGKYFPVNSSALSNLINGARTVLIFHAIVIIISIYIDSLFPILSITIAPFVMNFPNRILAALQHFNLESDPDKQDLFFSTRTIMLNPIIQFFYAGMNFHTEHHIFPSVPFYNLPFLHKRFREHDILINFEPNFISGIQYLYKNGYFHPVSRN